MHICIGLGQGDTLKKKLERDEFPGLPIESTGHTFDLPPHLQKTHHRDPLKSNPEVRIFCMIFLFILLLIADKNI